MSFRGLLDDPDTLHLGLAGIAPRIAGLQLGFRYPRPRVSPLGSPQWLEKSGKQVSSEIDIGHQGPAARRTVLSRADGPAGLSDPGHFCLDHLLCASSW